MKIKKLRRVLKHPLRYAGRRLKKAVVRKRSYRPIPVRQVPRGRPDIVCGRTYIEWLTHPELGRGRVLAYLPGAELDVEFEAGGRPAYGVPLEDIRILA